MTENQDMSQYLGIFMDEGREQLALLEQEILKMERGDHSQEILQSLFRAAHTLKGSSRAMGFMVIGDLTHEMENVLDDLRNNQIGVDTHVIDSLLDCLDALSALLESVAGFGDDTKSGREDIPALVKSLEVLRQSVKKPGTDEPQGETNVSALDPSDLDPEILEVAVASGASLFHVSVSVESDCLMKSVRIFMVNEVLRQMGSVMKSHPSEAELENDEFDGYSQSLFASQHDSDSIREAISKVPEILSFSVVPVAVTTAPPVLSSSDPIVSEEPRAAVQVRENRAESGSAASQTIRVGLDRLDSILNLVGELMIDRTQIARLTQMIHDAQPGDPTVSQLTEAIGRVSRITSELQEQVMKTRMLPIDGVFQRFPRMVRDLAQKTNKQVDFQTFGGETELDRSVIEVLGDPLIHILRNSVDHGLESPEEREAIGKPPVGKVSISARYEESRIVIDVSDDGRGIDPARIRRAAVEKGMVTQSVANAMSDRETISLILASGFSTAAKISDISGRGVGMDIVKSNLERIGGRVFIESKIGIGSTFTIHLPLTLAIVRAMIVTADGQTYIIPLSSVHEILSLGENKTEITRTTVAGKSVIVLRGETIPLAHLSELLNEDLRATDDKRIGKNCEVVVVGQGEGKVGVCVDHVVGEQEVVIKSLGSLLGEITGLSGASILGDGRVALIVDVGKAIEQLQNRAVINMGPSNWVKELARA